MTHEATIEGVGVTMEEGEMGAPVVLLEAREEVVPIFVDIGQARTIERALQGVPSERPMTHDLFVDVLDDADVTIDRVRIDDLSAGTFYAKLDLTVERDEPTEVVRDARPSDGLALAVRADCPVRIADEVIDEAGRTPETLGILQQDSAPGGPASIGPDPTPDPGRGGSGDALNTPEDPPDLDDPVDIELGEDEDRDDDPEPDA